MLAALDNPEFGQTRFAKRLAVQILF
jgi:hypothetical protein